MSIDTCFHGHLLVITCYFYGIIHSINWVFLVFITGITRALTAGFQVSILGVLLLLENAFGVCRLEAILASRVKIAHPGIPDILQQNKFSWF